MNYVNREDVITELLQYPDNLTARRWLKDDQLIDGLVELHNSWNSDHEREGKLDMVYDLEFHMETFLDEPRKTEEIINEVL